MSASGNPTGHSSFASSSGDNNANAWASGCDFRGSETTETSATEAASPHANGFTVPEESQKAGTSVAATSQIESESAGSSVWSESLRAAGTGAAVGVLSIPVVSGVLSFLKHK